MPHPEHAVDALTRLRRRPEAVRVAARASRRVARALARRTPPASARARSTLGLTESEYDAHRREAGPRAQRGRARDVLPAVERALLLQALARSCCGTLPTEGAHVVMGPGRTPAPSTWGTAWPSRSRSSRTTTRARSSRSRARPRASAASCATSSRSAPARSRCSTRCASASPPVRALALPARPRRGRDRALRQLDRRGDGRRRGLLRGSLRAELPRQRDGPRARRRRSGMIRSAAAGVGQRRRALRRLDRARRHRRRLGAGQRGARRPSEDKRPTVQVGDPFAEKKAAGVLARAARARPARLAAGPRRGGADLVVGGDGVQGRGRPRPRRRPRCRCARRTWSRSRSWSASPRSACSASCEPGAARRGARGLREVGGPRHGRSASSPTRGRLRVLDGDEVWATSPSSRSSTTARSTTSIRPDAAEPRLRRRRDGDARRGRRPARDAAGAARARRTSPRACRCSSSTTAIVQSRTVRRPERGRRRGPAAARRQRDRRGASTAPAAGSPPTRTRARSRTCSSARRTSPASAPSRSASRTA